MTDSTHRVNPVAYRAPEHHLRESQTLFHTSWLFAGLLLELEAKAHYGVRLGDTELLLQRDKQGRPRAFLNVCTHRQAQLCEPGVHAGPVRCPYHSWVFDQEGMPTGIPCRQAFPQVTASPEKFRLTEFACEAVGQSIFVRLAAEGPSLRAYLGNQYAFLERASAGMHSVQDEFQEEVHANWKVVIENSLEGYHVPAVHTRTFGQIDGMSREEQAPVFFLDDPRHSYLEHAADPDWIRRFTSAERKIGQWPWRFEHYTHRMIFPNLTVTSFMGYSFHIQRFDPVAMNRTRVHSRTAAVQFANSTAVGAKMIERIYADGHAFTRRVFAEDCGICRRVQAGLEQATRTAVLGIGIEDRVAHFQRAYLQAMPPA